MCADAAEQLFNTLINNPNHVLHRLRQLLVYITKLHGLIFYSAPQCSHCKRCTSLQFRLSVRLCVCPSVRLTHAGIVSKRRDVARCSWIWRAIKNKMWIGLWFECEWTLVNSWKVRGLSGKTVSSPLRLLQHYEIDLRAQHSWARHWLPVGWRVQFELCCIVYLFSTGRVQRIWQTLLSPSVPVRHVPSSINVIDGLQLRIKFGKRAFSHAGQAWRSARRDRLDTSTPET